MANASVTHELRVVALDGQTLVYKFTPRYSQVKVLSYKSGVPNSTASANYTIQAARRLYTLIQRKNRALALSNEVLAAYQDGMIPERKTAAELFREKCEAIKASTPNIAEQLRLMDEALCSVYC
jgi:hypothetical protein